MKKIHIIIAINTILLIGLLTIIINKNSKEYIMQDGVMLALTLDGEKITEYPEGTNYEVEINCENGKGKWLVEEWKLGVEEITGNVVCNIDFTSNPKVLRTEVESKATTNTNGFRYSGTNPDNYIWFNNEMWRIIGSIPTCLSASCGTNTTNLVKIIRNQIVGGLSYDLKSSGETGIWGNNTLYTILNTYYYGALDATNKSGCGGSRVNSSYTECDYRTIGINSNEYYGKMIKNVYWNTGASSNTKPNLSYTNEIATRTISGNVGLMSVSDYGYAANSSYHDTYLSNYNTLEITGTNWLYGQGYEWTISQYTSNTSQALSIEGSGSSGRISNGTVDSGYSVRPVVYLDPSVYIISGDGTEGNPYQIGM